MCNEYQLVLPFDETIEEFAQTRNPLVFPEGVPNFGPTASIRIGDRAPVIWAGVQGPEVRMTPWSWKGPGGRPVFNFRSDGRDFSNSLRCVIPADGFFEFTDPERGYKRKTKWRFTLKDQTSFWIAGLIKDGAFAMLTTEPGPDIAPYHDRQIVLLPKRGAMDWLDLTRTSADLLRPAPAGSLMIFHLLRKRGSGGSAQAERIRLSADQFIAAWGGDLHTAFWRAHDRAQDPAMPREERSVWRALVEEIDGRRPMLAPRSDSATRRLFRNRRG